MGHWLVPVARTRANRACDHVEAADILHDIGPDAVPADGTETRPVKHRFWSRQ